MSTRKMATLARGSKPMQHRPCGDILTQGNAGEEIEFSSWAASPNELLIPSNNWSAVITETGMGQPFSRKAAPKRTTDGCPRAPSAINSASLNNSAVLPVRSARPFCHDGEVACQFSDIPHAVRAEDHVDAISLEFFQRGVQVAPGCRVETCSGFIQHEHLGLQRQRGCQGYLAFFPSAQAGR